MGHILDKVKKAIDIELESLQNFRENLDPGFEDAIQLILNMKGKVIITGVGKSGDIAKKLSSTMTSTGTEAIFLHPTDATHGDAGLIKKEDIIIAIGKSGESDELIALIPTIKRIGARLVALTANPTSKLAKSADIVIITPVLKEACPLDLAPTSSTTIALVAGDAIAMALMELKDFREDNFALYHPAGRLGKRLSLNIEDVMRQGVDCPTVIQNANLSEILNEITKKSVGATCVIDSENNLMGIITDYDLRKQLSLGNLNNELKAEQIMNRSAIMFMIGLKAYDVLLEMEDRKRPISVAPIVNSDSKLMGIVSLHDLIQRGLK